MFNPERVLVATVAENREPFKREALYLFKTLQRFGGHLTRARQIAYFVESTDSATAKQLADLGVTIKIVEPVDIPIPYANKTQMLDDTEDFDYLVALDTDVVITRDFSPYIQGSSVAAKPAGRDPLSLHQWRKLFKYFGLELPLARYLTTTKMRETVPYFNSGVIIVPNQYISSLRNEWRSFILKLTDAHRDLSDITEGRVFTGDQYALSLALASARLPYRGLPLEMNFPTDRPVRAALEPEKLTPSILHHHHRLAPTGGIEPCSYENVNTMIAEINQYLCSNESGDLT